MRVRLFPDKNYKSIYNNGKTLRLALDPTKPILELDYPEFYDVKITNYCTGGCTYCYQNSTARDAHYDNILQKTQDFFGSMDENQKPFQVAIGGGNPNQHPNFCALLKLYSDLGITPNYTTNGIGLTEEVLEATAKYSGGVAITCHPHLNAAWTRAIDLLSDRGVIVNLHIVISDKRSVNRFIKIFEMFKDKVDYFVLLPLIEMGRAKDVAPIEYEYLVEQTEGLDKNKIAFGANFYPYLKDKNEYKLSLYEPEIMSKYLDMKDMSIHKSSFNLNQ